MAGPRERKGQACDSKVCHSLQEAWSRQGKRGGREERREAPQWSCRSPREASLAECGHGQGRKEGKEARESGGAKEGDVQEDQDGGEKEGGDTEEQEQEEQGRAIDGEGMV